MRRHHSLTKAHFIIAMAILIVLISTLVFIYYGYFLFGLLLLSASMIYFFFRRPELLGILTIVFSSTVPRIVYLRLTSLGPFDIRVWEITTLAAWFVVVFQRSREARRSPKRASHLSLPVALVMGSFSLSIIIGLLNGDYGLNKTIFYLFSTVFSGWGLFFIFKYTIKPEKVHQTVWMVVSIGLVTAVLSFLVEITRSYALIDLLFPDYAESPAYRGNLVGDLANLRFINPIGVGLVQTSLVLSVVGFFFLEKAKERLACLVIGFSCILYNLSTASRGLSALSAMTIIIASLFSLKNKNFRSLMAVIFMFNFALLAINQIDSFWLRTRGQQISAIIWERVVDPTQGLKSNLARLEATRYALERFAERPLFGWGAVSLTIELGPYQTGDINGLVGILFTYGIIGTLAFGLFLLCSFLSFRNKESLDSHCTYIRLSSITLIIVYIALSFSSTPFHAWPGPLMAVLGLHEATRKEALP